MVAISYYSTQQEQIRSLGTEVETYKKSIIKEEEKNEELTMLLNKVNADIGHVKKQIEVSLSKKDKLKAEYMTYTRTLQETEQSLAKANTVSHLCIFTKHCAAGHIKYILTSCY